MDRSRPATARRIPAPPARALLPLAAAALAALAPPARAQAPVVPNRTLSLDLVAGGDAAGGIFGFRGGLGFAPSPRVRFDLVGTLCGGASSLPGTDATVGRFSIEGRLGLRLGRVQPWVGAGVQKALLDGETVGTPTGPPCIPGTIICAPGSWTTGSVEFREEAVGPVVSAGVRLAATRSVVLGAELRVPLLDPVVVAPLGRSVDLGGPGLLVSVSWAFGPNVEPR